MNATLDDYSNPFEAISDFERAVAKYTGAPYCVATDSCTHALELSFRTLNHWQEVGLPARTYLSVPMTLHKLHIRYALLNINWHGEYNIINTRIWDSARKLEKGMYMDGQVQCLSFGRTKPLEIGRGGAILLDNEEQYNKLKRMAYDGRDLSISPWEDQVEFHVGYHYRMLPEEAIIGLNKLECDDINHDQDHVYPDLRKITISEKPG